MVDASSASKTLSIHDLTIGGQWSADGIDALGTSTVSAAGIEIRSAATGIHADGTPTIGVTSATLKDNGIAVDAREARTGRPSRVAALLSRPTRG